jgi:hypothetical protein
MSDNGDDVQINTITNDCKIKKKELQKARLIEQNTRNKKSFVTKKNVLIKTIKKSKKANDSNNLDQNALKSDEVKNFIKREERNKRKTGESNIFDIVKSSSNTNKVAKFSSLFKNNHEIPIIGE